MKKQLLDNIISKKNNKEEFAIVTNISTGENFIYEKNKIIDKNFENYSDEINNYFNNKQNVNIHCLIPNIKHFILVFCYNSFKYIRQIIN